MLQSVKEQHAGPTMSNNRPTLFNIRPCLSSICEYCHLSSITLISLSPYDRNHTFCGLEAPTGLTLENMASVSGRRHWLVCWCCWIHKSERKLWRLLRPSLAEHMS